MPVHTKIISNDLHHWQKNIHSITRPSLENQEKSSLGSCPVQLTCARLCDLTEPVVEEIFVCVHFWGHDAVLFSRAAGDTVAAGGTCTYVPVPRTRTAWRSGDGGERGAQEVIAWEIRADQVGILEIHTGERRRWVG